MFHSPSEPSKDHLDAANKYLPPPVEDTKKYRSNEKDIVAKTTSWPELHSKAVCIWPVGTESGWELIISQETHIFDERCKGAVDLGQVLQ